MKTKSRIGIGVVYQPSNEYRNAIVMVVCVGVPQFKFITTFCLN